MRVMVIVKATERSEAGEFGTAEEFAAMDRYNQQLVQAGVVLAGDGLQPSSKGKRVVIDTGGAAAVVDGPFAETKELVGGFAVVEARSREHALEMAHEFMKVQQDVLGPSWEGTCEIRAMFG